MAENKGADDSEEALLDAALLALDLLARHRGEARHAKAILLGRRAEHEPIDDRRALAEIAELERSGRSREAVAIVARRHAKTPAAQAAAARRYRRKRAQNETDTMPCPLSKP